MIEFEQIQAFFFVLMGICGFVAAVAGLVAIITRFWRWAHKQSDANSVRLDEHYTWLASDKRRIETLEKSQAVMQEQNKLILRALDTLIKHEVDGNHTKQLEAMSTEIYEYLFEKV